MLSLSNFIFLIFEDILMGRQAQRQGLTDNQTQFKNRLFNVILIFQAFQLSITFIKLNVWKQFLKVKKTLYSYLFGTLCIKEPQIKCRDLGFGSVRTDDPFLILFFRGKRYFSSCLTYAT